jgi:hypothetical protein
MKTTFYFVIFNLIFLSYGDSDVPRYEVNCTTLRMGQFLCPDPLINHIDPQTQQPRGCTKENTAKGMYFYYFY